MAVTSERVHNTIPHNHPLFEVVRGVKKIVGEIANHMPLPGTWGKELENLFAPRGGGDNGGVNATNLHGPYEGEDRS